VTWDEGSNGKDDPPMIVVSPNVKHGYVSNVPYDASAYLMTVETLLGVDPLPCNTNALGSTEPMNDVFAMPIDVPVGAATTN
jgi:hypothetical protein